MSAGPRLEIRYCRRCRFLPRASWIAQELPTSFAEELGEVALLPGEDGVFQVDLGA
jgi:selenoprotein W-related protein